MMKSAWFVCVAVAAAGCVDNDYNIHLEPAGNALDRKLTVRPSSRPVGDAPADLDESQARIAREYRTESPKIAKSYVYRGRFAGRMPTDVGGYGTFTRWETPLGSASVYVERFRGNDDAAADLKKRQQEADRLIDLVVGWLEGELKADPNWPALRRFLHDEVRHDLYNLSIYAWTYGVADRTDNDLEPFVRATQYLVERGYFSPEEIPTIRRAFADHQRGDSDRLIAWAKHLLATRIGGEAPRLPDHLSSTEGLAKSFSDYLEKTEEYAELHRKWEAERKTNPNAKQPEGTEVLGPLVLHLFLGEFRLGGDRVTVALKSGAPAIKTNGQWSAESSEITWSPKWLSDEGFPRLIYSIWDEPNEVAQQKHFGKVVLRGESLFGYCTWYHGLTREERGEWDAFVDGRQPGPELEKELREFRFQQEPADIDKDHRLAGPTVEELVKGLKP